MSRAPVPGSGAPKRSRCRFATRSSRPGPTSAEPSSRPTRASRGHARSSRPNSAMPSPAATRWPRGSVEEGLGLGYLVDREFEAAERHLIGPSVGEESLAFHRLGRDGPPRGSPPRARRPARRPRDPGRCRGPKPIDGRPGRCSDRASDGAPLALSLDGDAVGEAEERAHAALAHAASGPFPSEVVGALELLSSTAVARESWTEAARLHGAAEQLRGLVRISHAARARAGAV